jgi:hypothetical protein
MTSTPDITIRRADERDSHSIARLAALDSTHAPQGLVLVAETDDELWAAISADDGHVAADPFRPSGESAELLRAHVASISGSRRTRGTRRWMPVMPRAA